MDGTKRCRTIKMCSTRKTSRGHNQLLNVKVPGQVYKGKILRKGQKR